MPTLDLRGMLLPFVLLKTSNAFKEMNAGETLEIRFGNPDALKDLFKILPPRSYRVTAMKKIETEDTEVCLQLLKTITPK